MFQVVLLECPTKLLSFGVDCMRDLLKHLQLSIVAMSAFIVVTVPVQAQMRYEPGDEYISNSVDDDDGYFSTAKLEIGEHAYTTYPNLKLCFGKYAMMGRVHFDEAVVRNDDGNYPPPSWWKVERVSRTTLALEFILQSLT